MREKNDAVVVAAFIVVVAAAVVFVASVVVFALVVVVAIEITAAELLLLFSCKEHPYFGATVFSIRNGDNR